MARVSYGGLITDLSGSIGGLTFQRSNYGGIARTKPISVNKNSQPQSRIRSLLNQVHYHWRALSDVQRDQWRRYIEFSNTYCRRSGSSLLTGHDLFIKYNMLRLTNNIPVLTVPDYSVIDLTFSIDRLAHVVSQYFLLIFNDTIESDSLWFSLKLSPSRLPSRSWSPSGFRQIVVPRSTYSYYAIDSQLYAAFGRLPLPGEILDCSLVFFSLLTPMMTNNIVLRLTVTSE
jgi:hypothetical protein